jgi:hypothetical protein
MVERERLRSTSGDDRRNPFTTNPETPMEQL